MGKRHKESHVIDQQGNWGKKEEPTAPEGQRRPPKHEVQIDQGKKKYEHKTAFPPLKEQNDMTAKQKLFQFVLLLGHTTSWPLSYEQVVPL